MWLNHAYNGIALYTVAGRMQSYMMVSVVGQDNKNVKTFFQQLTLKIVNILYRVHDLPWEYHSMSETSKTYLCDVASSIYSGQRWKGLIKITIYLMIEQTYYCSNFENQKKMYSHDINNNRASFLGRS